VSKTNIFIVGASLTSKYLIGTVLSLDSSSIPLQAIKVVKYDSDRHPNSDEHIRNRRSNLIIALIVTE